MCVAGAAILIGPTCTKDHTRLTHTKTTRPQSILFCTSNTTELHVCKPALLAQLRTPTALHSQRPVHLCTPPLVRLCTPHTTTARHSTLRVERGHRCANGEATHGQVAMTTARTAAVAHNPRCHSCCCQWVALEAVSSMPKAPATLAAVAAGLASLALCPITAAWGAAHCQPPPLALPMPS